MRMVNTQILRGPVSRTRWQSVQEGFPLAASRRGRENLEGMMGGMHGRRSTESAGHVQGTVQSAQGGGSRWELTSVVREGEGKTGFDAGDYGAIKGDR